MNLRPLPVQCKFGALSPRALLAFILIKWTICSPVLKDSSLEIAVAENFLERYGYLLEKNPPHSSGELTSAVREFQWLSHLPVTGSLDSTTLQQMATPRCGVKDGRSHHLWAQRVAAIFTGKGASGKTQSRRKRYALLGEKWHKKELTYRIVTWPRHLSPSTVRLVVRAAFQLWSNVSGLTFTEAPQGLTDIRLAFYEGEHNDGAGNAFDGPGGALAHAFFPCRGEAHFDMAERWTLNGHKGHNLFTVAAHEIGHTLGLEHSPARSALMSPYYRKLGHSLVPSWDDVAAVQQLYGKPPGGQPVRLPGQVISLAMQDWEVGEPLGEIPGNTQPVYCQGVFDAITMDQNRTVLVFRGGLYWTVSTQGNVSSPLPIQQRWPRLPPAIEAAAFSPLDSKWYFFKGKGVWRYLGDHLDPGFPRKSSELGLPRHPDCVFYYGPLGHLVLFKGSRYSVLNLSTLRSEPYYPRKLVDWTGVPRGANGALTRPNGQLYLFREQQYWKFDPVQMRVTGGGMWAQELEWIGCNKPAEGNDIL